MACVASRGVFPTRQYPYRARVPGRLSPMSSIRLLRSLLRWWVRFVLGRDTEPEVLDPKDECCTADARTQWCRSWLPRVGQVSEIHHGVPIGAE